MKKLISLILAFAMVFSLGLPAYAAGITGETQGNVTASYTPSTPAEAKWGASKDSLTGSGTLAEAIAAAEADSTVKYIQLQSDVTAESGFIIRSGEFTIDLNGQTVTSDSYTFDVRNSGTKVTFADSGTTGAAAGYVAICPSDGAEVLITGGSYSGSDALLIYSGSSATITGGTFTGTDGYAINNGGILTISGGTFGGSMANIGVSGTATITGGTFTGSGIMGNFAYWSDTLDLSGYSDVTGLQVSNYSGSDLAVSDTTIKLPANYTFVDDSNNPVTTLTYETVYTIAAVSGGEDTTAEITGVTVKLNGVEVTEPGEIKVATSDTLTVIFEGKNFENMTEEYLYQVGTGGAETLYYYERDTTSTPNTITLTYAGYQLNGSNQSPIAYTNAGEAATETGYTLTYQMVYHVSINGNSGGTVTADKTDAVAGTLITLTVAPDEGYALYSLAVYDETIVSEIEYTKVNDTTYTFTMPAAAAAVAPSFRKFGTELETIYFKNTEGWETIRAVFSSSDGVALGSADLTMVEAGIYATTDIPEWASKVYFTDSQVTQTETVEIPTDGSDLFTPDGGTSEDGYLTGTWSKYTTSTPETNTVNIVWGSMAFTYTDGSGWANDGSNGAGTVTVTNTGTTAITATPSYAATTDEYGTFTGSFDEDSIGIAAGANWTFKLTLDGTPTKAIPTGTKIGTVTVTITEAVEVPDESENAAPEDSTLTPNTPNNDPNTAE